MMNVFDWNRKLQPFIPHEWKNFLPLIIPSATTIYRKHVLPKLFYWLYIAPSQVDWIFTGWSGSLIIMMMWVIRWIFLKLLFFFTINLSTAREVQESELYLVGSLYFATICNDFFRTKPIYLLKNAFNQSSQPFFTLKVDIKLHISVLYSPCIVEENIVLHNTRPIRILHSNRHSWNKNKTKYGAFVGLC